ncbi:hypothetical Protein YC6258_00831 [Gynuella sunshinyii YC6258]|uniref:Uncharacterized protein n=1 Tax=Gynuella sunshinyii YC6258 TaxID=1445510 RepID=A0A0C5VFD4_9GAMM|nr:hypothetical Protein YC6258_00831 [Gynuella sunshinyii YC6258]
MLIIQRKDFDDVILISGFNQLSHQAVFLKFQNFILLTIRVQYAGDFAKHGID